MMHFADSHVHLTDDSFELTKGMFDLMRDSGVTDVTMHSLPYRGIHNNLKALYWKTHYTDMKMRAFGALYEFGTFSDIDPLTQVKRLMELGCDGLKMMEMNPLHRKKRGFGVDHVMYDPMFSWLEENDIPVTMHVNDPETNWEAREMSEEEIRRGWFYGDGTFPTKQEIYDETFAMLDKHPKLRVTFAHFFFLSNFIDEAERVMEKYPNVNFDLTPGWEMYLGFSKDIDCWHDFFEKYSHRILFGTDSNNFKPNNDKLNELVLSAITHDRSEFPMPCFFHDMICGLYLSEEAIQNIKYNTYLRFVGDTPKKVDDAEFRKEAEYIRNAVRNDPEQAASVNWLNTILES